jgi:hypothetical protein
MLRQAMSEMGRRGGLAAAKKMTAKQRTERARKAGKARQAKASYSECLIESFTTGGRIIPAYRILLELLKATVMSAVMDPAAESLGTMEFRTQVFPPSVET